MTNEIADLLYKLNDPEFIDSDVIPWSCPILSFGDYKKSKIATLGINPSNREFVDINGLELKADRRRFHTLNSLGIEKWSEVNDNHLSLINESFQEYFYRNPYDGWFKKLDYLISGTSMSYYFPSGEACHLDLIPYATTSKWSDLKPNQKNKLLDLSIDFLGKIIKESKIKVIVLNGQTVVDNVQKVTNVKFSKNLMENWTLNRKNNKGVKGYSYVGEISSIGSIKLSKEVKILGFNHNIQSSFGVSFKIQSSIRNWITLKINTYFNESK